MALERLQSLGYEALHGPDIAPGGLRPERASYEDVVLRNRLEMALYHINPSMPDTVIQEAMGQIINPDSPDLGTNNHHFHRYVTNGVNVEYRDDSGQIRGAQVWLFDFEDPEANDWVAVNQFRVVEGDNTRRCDIVLFVNGLPLAVIELKDPEDPQATPRTAFDQLQTYMQELPTLFRFNEALVISDGYKAQHGTITAGWERFMPWRTTGGTCQ